MAGHTARRLSRRGFLRGAGAAAGLAAGGAWLAGCAPTSSPPPAKPAASATTSAAPAAPAAATAGASGADAAPLKLGVLVVLAGPYALLGESIVNGMQLYLDSAGNRAGGRPIALLKEDEGTSPDDSLRKARRLIEQEGVDLLAGVVNSANAYAIRDLVHDSRTLFLCANAGANDLTRARKSPYIFRTSYANAQLSMPMGEYVYKNVGRRVFVSGSDFAAGHEIIDGFRETFQAAGGEVVGEAYPAFGTTDFAAYLTQIAQARPAATFNFYAGAEAVSFVKQYAEFGLSRDIRLCGQGSMVEQDTLPAQGAAARGAITGFHWALTLDNPENRQFTQAYRQRFGREADAWAMQGYDTARVIVEAVNGVQGNTSNKERLIEALTAIKFASPRGPFEFDPDTHNAVQNVYAREVREVAGGLANVVVDTFPRVRFGT